MSAALAAKSVGGWVGVTAWLPMVAYGACKSDGCGANEGDCVRGSGNDAGHGQGAGGGGGGVMAYLVASTAGGGATALCLRLTLGDSGALGVHRVPRDATGVQVCE